MKKLYSVFMSLGCACILLGGCGSDMGSDTAESQEYISLEGGEVTISPGLVGHEVSDVSESAVVEVDDDNGAVTYSLSGQEQSDIVNGMATEISGTISNILEDDGHYPNVEDITVNDNYSEFTIKLTDGNMTQSESTLSLLFCMKGNKYQIYSGTSEDDALTTVTYVNAATGETIAQIDSSSMVTE